MPVTLPNPENERRKIIQPTEQINAPSVIPEGSAEGDMALGEAISGLGQAIDTQIKERVEREENSEYTHAKTEYEIAQIELSTSYDERDDYSVWDDDYQKKSQQLTDDLAAKISNPELREAFVNETRIGAAVGRAKLMNKARKKEIDVGTATLQSSLDRNLDALVRTDDEAARTELITAAKHEINNAYSNGYIDANQKQDLIEKYKHDYAFSRIHALEPQQQLDAIKNAPWSKHLTANEVTNIRESAKEYVKEQQLDFEVFATTDKIIAAGGGYATWVNKARNIQDAEKRKRVMSEIDHRQRQQQMIDADNKRQMSESVLQGIVKGDVTRWTQIPLDVRLGMDASDRHKFQTYLEEDRGRPSLEQQRLNYVQLSIDPSLWKGLTPADLLQFPDEYHGDIMGGIIQNRIAGRAPQLADSEQKVKIRDMLIARGEDDEEVQATIISAISAHNADRIAAKQPAMSVPELEREVNQLLRERVRARWYTDWFGEIGEIKQPAVEIIQTYYDDPDDVVVPPEVAEEILQFGRKEGTFGPDEAVPDEVIKEYYINELRMGVR